MTNRIDEVVACAGQVAALRERLAATETRLEFLIAGGEMEPRPEPRAAVVEVDLSDLDAPLNARKSPEPPPDRRPAANRARPGGPGLLDRILAVLSDGRERTYRELAMAIPGHHASTVGHAAGALCATGRVVRVRRGTYRAA